MSISIKFATQIAVVNIVCFISIYIASFYPYDDLLNVTKRHFGADFLCFHTAGYFALHDPSSLYDPDKFAQFAAELLPAKDNAVVLPFMYPPFIALFFAGFSLLSYPTAVCIFFALSALLLVVGFNLVARSGVVTSRMKPNQIVLLLLGSPVTIEALFIGQLTGFIALLFSAVVYLFSKKQFVFAGFILGLLLIKPNLTAPFVLGCAIIVPAVIIPAIITYLIGILLSAITFGTSTVKDYFDFLFLLGTGSVAVPSPPHKIQSLASYIELLISNEAAKLLLPAMGIIAVTIVAAVARRKKENKIFYLGVLLLLSCLCNSYLPIYDVVYVTLAISLLARNRRVMEFCEREPVICSYGLLLLYFGPHLSQGLFPLFDIQIFPALLLLFLVHASYRFARSIRTSLPG